MVRESFRIPELENVEFGFDLRPEALPPELRPLWRVAVLILILHLCCRNKRSNMHRLYVLNWAVRTPEARADLLDLLANKLKPNEVIVRFDPSLLRAIDLATGAGLLARVGGDKFELTSQGQRFADSLLEIQAFDIEKDFLKSIKSRVSEARIVQLMDVGLL